jgi:ribosome-associated protein
LWGRTSKRVDAGGEQGSRGVVIEPKQLAIRAARAASSKQGQHIMVLDVQDLIAITDYFVIASAASDRQVKTITEEVSKDLKEAGIRPVRREGGAETGWVLLDFADFVVHVFRDQEWEFYRLENLWRDAPVVAWEEEVHASSG